MKSMLLAKLRTAAAALLLAAAGAGTVGLIDHARAADPPNARPGNGPRGEKAGADPVGALWSDYWRRQHKGVTPSALPVDLAPAAKVTRTKTALVLPVTVTNRSSQDVVARLAHEWHGGEWPPTDLYASVTPAAAKEVVRFAPAYLAGEDEKADQRVTIPAGKAVTAEVRMDWPGTGSQPAVPFLTGPASGTYRVRLLLVFEVKEGRQFVASAEKAVELPAE
jgi:hypothetical protein